MSISPDHQSPPGVVELREDVPLKASNAASGPSSGAVQCAGPRLILGAFAALSAAITLALLTQIYYGDYEVVPHGSVAGSGEACSQAGTGALRAGGRAFDAVATAALCLAARTPHRTGLDASGSLLYWEYRTARSQGPLLMEWGGPPGSDVTRPPRLVAALAALHVRFGALPWSQLLQPAINVARSGFPVSAALAGAAAARGLRGYPEGGVHANPALANYLQNLQLNTSAELCAAWNCDASVHTTVAQSVLAGVWRVWAGGAGGRTAAAALAAAFPASPEHRPSATEALTKIVGILRQQSLTHPEDWPAGVASGLAAVDPQDTYAALVTGLSTAFGSQAADAGAGTAAGGWTRDTPHAPLGLAPALLVDQHVCGTRYVIGAESAAALAQSAAAALAGTALPDAVEGGRLLFSSGGTMALEAGRAPPPSALLAALQPAPLAATLNATLPYAAVNLVQQRGDALLSHADSRGGGYASRF